MELFEITPVVIGVLLIGMLVGNFAIMVFLGSKDPSSRMFVKMLLATTLWIFHVAFWYSARDPELALFGLRSAYFYGVLTGIYFYHFCRTFPENSVLPELEKKLLSLVSYALLLAYYVPYLVSVVNTLYNSSYSYPKELVASHMYPSSGMQYWGYEFGDLWFLLFDGPFLSFWLLGFIVLYKKYRETRSNQKLNIKFMLVAMLFGAVPPALINVVLPHFHIFSIHPYGILSSIGWVSILGYAIMKHNQMNVRAVYAELLVFAGIMLLFINLFL